MSFRKTIFRRGAALGLFMLSLGAFMLSLGAAAPLFAEPFRFPWDPPERPAAKTPMRQRALTPPALSQQEVRSVLAREGARLIGAPQRRGGETIAVGRDGDGARRKFTLDANGQVVDIEFLPPEPARARERPPEFSDDLRSLDRPLPAPRHSPEGPDDLPQLTPPPPAATVARPAASSVPTAAPPPAPRKEPDASDASLSPIKPLHPPGAPRIEPLPQ